MTAVESVLANPYSLLVTEEERTETYGKGRICARKGCGAVLSEYNPDDYCSIHTDDQYDPRTLAMDYTEDGNRRCVKCGRAFAPNLRCFYSDPRSKDGLSAECVACLNPKRAEKERATQRRAGRRYQERNRAQITARRRAKREAEG